MNFADLLAKSIRKRKSILCAGIDIRSEQVPSCFVPSDLSGEEKIEKALTDYCLTAVEVVEPHVACIKPNAAFFEQFGLGALRALNVLCARAKELELPVILDAKRGDIGSTNEAYANAYLSPVSLFDEKPTLPQVDALTVNPFLGLESSKPFIEAAKKSGKGIFLLVRTSNPDAAFLQEAQIQGGEKETTVTEAVAKSVAANGEILKGDSGLSSLGAVVGATQPEEAVKLRELMANNFFLVPGYGKQGGSAKEALAGAIASATSLEEMGVIVNSSRGLFSLEDAKEVTKEQFKDGLLKKTAQAKEDLSRAAF